MKTWWDKSHLIWATQSFISGVVNLLHIAEGRFRHKLQHSSLQQMTFFSYATARLSSIAPIETVFLAVFHTWLTSSIDHIKCGKDEMHSTECNSNYELKLDRLQLHFTVLWCKKKSSNKQFLFINDLWSLRKRTTDFRARLVPNSRKWKCWMKKRVPVIDAFHQLRQASPLNNYKKMMKPEIGRCVPSQEKQ